MALHALKNEFAGKVRQIYIDPPYNTGKDSFNYNDKFNHSSWLVFMKNRLEIAWELLSDDGTIWISIDGYESHYLKVLADGIFGAENFLDEVVWQRAYAPINLKKTFSKSHDYILVYAKNNSGAKELNRLPRKAEMVASYKNPDNDPRGVYKADNFSVGPAVEKNIYEITTPSGRKVLPPDGYSWRFSKERFEELLADNRVYFGKMVTLHLHINDFYQKLKMALLRKLCGLIRRLDITKTPRKKLNRFLMVKQPLAHQNLKS